MTTERELANTLHTHMACILRVLRTAHRRAARGRSTSAQWLQCNMRFIAIRDAFVKCDRKTAFAASVSDWFDDLYLTPNEPRCQNVGDETELAAVLARDLGFAVTSVRFLLMSNFGKTFKSGRALFWQDVWWWYVRFRDTLETCGRNVVKTKVWVMARDTHLQNHVRLALIEGIGCPLYRPYTEDPRSFIFHAASVPSALQLLRRAIPRRLHDALYIFYAVPLVGSPMPAPPMVAPEDDPHMCIVFGFAADIETEVHRALVVYSLAHPAPCMSIMRIAPCRFTFLAPSDAMAYTMLHEALGPFIDEHITLAIECCL